MGRTIYARGILKCISYDLENMLKDEEMDSKIIVDSLLKRLNNLKNPDKKIHKVVWE